MKVNAVYAHPSVHTQRLEREKEKNERKEKEKKKGETSDFLYRARKKAGTLKIEVYRLASLPFPFFSVLFFSFHFLILFPSLLLLFLLLDEKK